MALIEIIIHQHSKLINTLFKTEKRFSKHCLHGTKVMSALQGDPKTL